MLQIKDDWLIIEDEDLKGTWLCEKKYSSHQIKNHDSIIRLSF